MKEPGQRLQIFQEMEAYCNSKLCSSFPAEAGYTSKPKVVYHFHNHSIGLNPHYEDVVFAITRTFPTLLQIHDFVEDGRDTNLKNLRDWKKAYPSGAHILYTTINSRDQQILKNAGATTCEILPNCYRPTQYQAKQKANNKIVFYPVQALRRKNLGELLLLSMFSPEGYRFYVGQTPSNGNTLVDFWQQLAEELELPVEFDVSDKAIPPGSHDPSFASWYDSCSHVITTSIQEGFGMAFIEPIYFGKPLLGRDLPTITRDIKQKGIQHSSLYQKISLSKELIAKANLEAHLAEGIDFGSLNEMQQVKVLLTLHGEPDLIRSCSVEEKPLPQFLQKAFEAKPKVCKEMLQPWSFEQLKLNLKSLYGTLAEQNIAEGPSLDQAAIKASFDSFTRLGIKHEQLDIEGLQMLLSSITLSKSVESNSTSDQKPSLNVL